MKLLLLTTCGTSVLTNQAPDETRRWLSEIANRAELAKDEMERLAAHVERRRAQFMHSNEVGRRAFSAEINGIAAALKRFEPRRTQHVLVHTDTVVGKVANGLVADALRSAGQDVQLITASGLRTDDANSFREAIAELTRRIEEYGNWRSEGWTVIFNLTGGFKAINAYLQALGMLHADRCVFLFESSPALMEIPRLPIHLADLDTVRNNLLLFRQLKFGYPVPICDTVGIPESLLLFDDECAATSVWGDVVWERARKVIYAEEIQPPLSRSLILGAKRELDRNFESLPTERRIQVNDALDALSARLDGLRPHLRSETFKRLQGNPMPPSTHEMYAWTGHGTGRLFGHYIDGKFVVDALDVHL